MVAVTSLHNQPTILCSGTITALASLSASAISAFGHGLIHFTLTKNPDGTITTVPVTQTMIDNGYQTTYPVPTYATPCR